MRPEGAGGVRSRKLEGEIGRPIAGVPGTETGVASPVMVPRRGEFLSAKSTISSISACRMVDGPALRVVMVSVS